MARMHRYASTVVQLMGHLGVPTFLIKRMGGSNTVTNPGIVRRVISYILCFRKSERSDCHLLHYIGGHCNSAGRVNIFRVDSGNLRRIRGPSRVLLSNHPLGIDNTYITYGVRKAEPVLTRMRNLISPANFNGPHHVTANFSCGHLTLVLTILRGQTNCFFSGLSACIGIMKNL